MAIIYVACSLTDAPESFIQFVSELKVLLRTEGHEVMEFFGLGDGSATEVYEMDIHRCVEECEVMLALCDIASTGLGWELGKAVEMLKKPTLALAHVKSKVSRLPIGADCGRNPRYRFQLYVSLEDILFSLNRFLKDMSVSAHA